MLTTETKERPILFSAPMVRAILSGDKTQTRRVVKTKQIAAFGVPTVVATKCPYGEVGDRLWVRETWAPFVRGDGTEDGWVDLIIYHADGTERAVPLDFVDEFNIIADKGYHKRPSIFMPRWASRITLEITDIRVERLNDISIEDAIREGAPIYDDCENQTHGVLTWFEETWESINGAGSWEANPWVWAISFRRVQNAE